MVTLTWNSILLILPAALITDVVPVFLPRAEHELILSSHCDQEALVLGVSMVRKH